MGSNSGAAYGTNFTSIERFKFGDGNDYFRAPFVTSEGFQVQGGDGNDTIIGSNGNDRFFGDAGNDVINGGAGQDTLDGGAGIDFMKGGSGRDFYYIDSATFGVWDNADDEDVVNDDWSDSVIYIAASMGVSLAYVTSSIGRIELLEAAEEGYIVTGSGNDVLVGNVFSNYLSGRAGADRLTGGGGSDIFVFDTAAHTAQRDTITDFTSGVDGLMFNSGLFDSSAQFYSVAKFAKAAALLEDQAAFIYDRSTGILHYDGDGRGAGLLAEEVVSLGKGTVLSSSDIFID
jgi:Ca2+-binding RTX toxin-like protein